MAFQLGFQSAVFAVLTTTYAIKQGFRPSSPHRPFLRVFTLERGDCAGLPRWLSAVAMAAAFRGLVSDGLRAARLRLDDASGRARGDLVTLGARSF